MCYQLQNIHNICVNFNEFLRLLLSDGESVSVLAFCNKDPSMTCWLCECIDECFLEILCLYAIGYLVVRPGMFAYSYIYNMNMRDVVPPIVNVLVHLGVSFRCIMTFICNGKNKPKIPILDTQNFPCKEKTFLNV